LALQAYHSDSAASQGAEDGRMEQRRKETASTSPPRHHWQRVFNIIENISV